MISLRISLCEIDCKVNYVTRTLGIDKFCPCREKFHLSDASLKNISWAQLRV